MHVRTRARLAPLALAAALHASIAGTVLLLAEPAAWADGAAAQKLLDKAKEKFDEGTEAAYNESIQYATAALLKVDVSDAQKVESYRLMAYDFILLKREDDARTAVYHLLALDEDFTLPKKESPRFRDPFTKFKQQWIDEGKPFKAKATEVAPAAVTIKHLPASEAPHDRALEVKGTIDDPDKRVAKVFVYYRAGSSGPFENVTASYGLGSFQANIPSSAVKPPLVEYYVEALDESEAPIATRGDPDVPLRVVVQAEKDGGITSEWWFWTGVGVGAVGIGLGAYFLFKPKHDTGPSGPNSTVTITIHQ